MLRKRKRHSTHRMLVYKYRTWFEGDRMKLPEPVYELAKHLQDCWSEIAVHHEQAWAAWREAHPWPEGLTGEPLNAWLKANKPPKTFHEANQAWAEAHVEAAQFPDELGKTLLERLAVVWKNMRHGGGPPQIHRRLDRFIFHHRYTSGGLPIDHAGGERAKRFRIQLPAAELFRPVRGVKNSHELRRQRLTRAWFRVAGQTLPLRVQMHRPLPEGDVWLKRVALAGRRFSPALPWEIYIMMSLEVPLPPQAEAHEGTVCGVDVGWRKLDDDSMRVAVLYDGHSTDELIMPLRFFDRQWGEISLARLRNIQHCRDGALEKIKAKLAPLLNPLPPAWVQTRNGGLIRMLCDRATPASVRQTLLDWKQENDRYLRLARNVEARMRGRYEWTYRNWAKSVAKSYRTVRIKKLNQREMWERGAAQENYALLASAERRKLAACGQLLLYLRQAVEEAGGQIETVEAAHTTDICARCGHKFTVGAQRLGRCVSGHEEDQDINAARNIYANLRGIPAEMQLS